MDADYNYAVAPGDFLQEWLDDTATTQQEAADRLDCSRKHVNGIVNGRTPVTPDMALRLQRLTGIPVDTWLVYEAGYRADLERLLGAVCTVRVLEVGPDGVMRLLAHEHGNNNPAVDAGRPDEEGAARGRRQCPGDRRLPRCSAEHGEHLDQ